MSSTPGSSALGQSSGPDDRVGEFSSEYSSSEEQEMEDEYGIAYVDDDEGLEEVVEKGEEDDDDGRRNG